MRKANILTKKKLLGFLVLFELVIFFLAFRIFFIQVCQTNFWQEKAYEQQTRDRLIKPNRGMIFDRNMISLAKTQSVNSISVIHAQIKEPEKVASVLAKKLALDYDETLKKRRDSKIKFKWRDFFQTYSTNLSVCENFFYVIKFSCVAKILFRDNSRE